ncbi:hypothetical protein NOV72_00900 [Caballeronia novacaledonica]|uniref:DUF2894 domain-containing protein n=1 Tax=Caballeronia novacaledonica TaxID=1544861 RepID=A0A2U3I0N0_9BURK|nr:DUF2894 domain-containing protein [Caballeronia novacaledonica]SPB13636.1 hypothetical protein NOV72_00900 [Caballeronia novacaledonica]
MTNATPARAMLDAWRASGDDRANPVRFHLIDALDKRAAAYEGETRRVLDARVAQLLDAYRSDIERAASQRAAIHDDDERGPLAALVEDIAKSSSMHKASHAELLDYFRAVWSKVSAEKQLRDSLAQVPRNAGPLNSSSLVHRSLSLMREVSPGYFQQFLAYADALSWMEELNGPGFVLAKDAAGAKKGGRKKK